MGSGSEWTEPDIVLAFRCFDKYHCNSLVHNIEIEIWPITLYVSAMCELGHHLFLNG